MVPVRSLWLPILVSAVAVFVISSLLHMLLKYHNDDYLGLPDEAAILDALRPFHIPPGNYMFPRAGGLKEAGTPEFKAKWAAGPVGFVTIVANQAPGMAKELVQWFIYLIVVSIFAAYIAGRALDPGAPYLQVFRFVGATAFIGYCLALWQNTIWYKVRWTTALKQTIDGLIYAAFTAGIFGWLWPM
ncbi:MAG: hypothetical protein FIB01_03470 [Gemmatimonadetes bacterium]|nr:hypothetical protein [Gemmatimonadota bacterium]